MSTKQIKQANLAKSKKIKTLKDIGHGTAEETIRVLKLSPKWTPGKVNKKPVRTQYSLPISIQSVL